MKNNHFLSEINVSLQKLLPLFEQSAHVLKFYIQNSKALMLSKNSKISKG